MVTDVCAAGLFTCSLDWMVLGNRDHRQVTVTGTSVRLRSAADLTDAILVAVDPSVRAARAAVGPARALPGTRRLHDRHVPLDGQRCVQPRLPVDCRCRGHGHPRAVRPGSRAVSAAALQAAMVAAFADVFGLLVPVFADLPDGSWVQRRTVIRS